MEAIKKTLNPTSEKQTFLTEEESVSKNEEFGFTRAETLTTIFSAPKSPMNRTRPVSARRPRRSTLLPSDQLIRSEICEALKINESKLTIKGGKLSLESKDATKKFKKYALQYHKEISGLKNELKLRKKETLLEHFDPKLKKVLSHPPSKFTAEKETLKVK